MTWMRALLALGALVLLTFGATVGVYVAACEWRDDRYSMRYEYGEGDLR